MGIIWSRSHKGDDENLYGSIDRQQACLIEKYSSGNYTLYVRGYGSRITSTNLESVKSRALAEVKLCAKIEIERIQQELDKAKAYLASLEGQA